MSVIRPSKCLQLIKLHDCKIFVAVERALITCFTVTSYRYFLGGGGGMDRGAFTPEYSIIRLTYTSTR